MDNAAYHAHPAISKSHLDKINRSPLHYWARYVDPKRLIPEPTPSMRLGSAVHTHVLELDKWDSEWAVAPAGIDRRTKAGKETWAQFQAIAVGKQALTAEEGEAVQHMGRAVWGHPAAAMLLGMDGEAETTHMWRDSETGLQCKCRPDWLSADGKVVVDLKTTRDASPRGFRHSVMQYRYGVQAAWYSHGIEQSTGVRPEAFIFVAVESEAPYGVGVYAADAELIEHGWRQARRDLQRLAECREADRWPSYSDSIETLTLPDWAKKGAAAPVTTEEIEGF
jgi:hypothetical protein